MCPKCPPGLYYSHLLFISLSVFCLRLARSRCHGNNSLPALITEQTATARWDVVRNARSNECNVGLEVSDGVPPCLIWSCFSEIPDIYWPILIQCVKSLMFSMCNLTTLQWRKTCFQMFRGESLSLINAVLSLSFHVYL